GHDAHRSPPSFPTRRSSDLDRAWTSGQWMTETEGGSDVGRATTRAVEDDAGWRLHGEKWFCSATTAEMAVALARPDGAPPGSAGDRKSTRLNSSHVKISYAV